MHNGTDYIMVFQDDREPIRIGLLRGLSHANIRSSIDNWWEKSGVGIY